MQRKLVLTLISKSASRRAEAYTRGSRPVTTATSHCRIVCELQLFLDISWSSPLHSHKERKRVCRYQLIHIERLTAANTVISLSRDPYCFSVIVRLIVKYDSLYNNKCQFILYLARVLSDNFLLHYSLIVKTIYLLHSTNLYWLFLLPEAFAAVHVKRAYTYLKLTDYIQRVPWIPV